MTHLLVLTLVRFGWMLAYRALKIGKRGGLNRSVSAESSHSLGFE
jgi:hypothetical protein